MNQNPKDWKTYDQFAYGIDTNRLPATEALAGSSHTISFEDGRRFELAFARGEVKWSDGKDSATDKAEVIEVAPNTYFVEIVFAGRSKEAETLILNIQTRRVLSIYSIVRDAKDAVGEPFFVRLSVCPSSSYNNHHQIGGVSGGRRRWW